MNDNAVVEAGVATPSRQLYLGGLRGVATAAAAAAAGLAEGAGLVALVRAAKRDD